MPKANSVTVQTKESHTALPSIATGPEVDLTKEVIMNNSNSAKLLKNIPVKLSADADKLEVIVKRDLLVQGTLLEVKEYSDGYIGITNPAFDGMAAGKDAFHYLGETRGLFIAFSSVIGNSKAELVHGFHCVEGLKNVLLTRDEKKDGFGRRIPRAYVNWKILLNPLYREANQSTIDMLATFGITPKADAELGRWLAIGAKNNSLYPLYPVVTRTFPEFKVWFNETQEEPVQDWKSERGKNIIREWYEKDWNTYYRHEALEVILHVLEGTTRIGVKFYPFENDTNPEITVRKWDEMMAKHYLALFQMTPEERAARKEKEDKDGDVRRRLNRTTFASTNNENFKFGVQANIAAEGGKVVMWNIAKSEAEKLTAKALVGTTIKFVYGDGTPVNDTELPIRDIATAIGAINMADKDEVLVGFIS